MVGSTPTASPVVCGVVFTFGALGAVLPVSAIGAASALGAASAVPVVLGASAVPALAGSAALAGASGFGTAVVGSAAFGAASAGVIAAAVGVLGALSAVPVVLGASAVPAGFVVSPVGVGVPVGVVWETFGANFVFIFVVSAVIFSTNGRPPSSKPFDISAVYFIPVSLLTYSVAPPSNADFASITSRNTASLEVTSTALSFISLSTVVDVSVNPSPVFTTSVTVLGAVVSTTGSATFGAVGSVGFTSVAFAGSVGLVSFATLSDSALLNSFLTSSTVFLRSLKRLSKPSFNLSKKPFSPSIAACSIFAETSLVSTSFS